MKRSRCESASSHLLAAVPVEKVKNITRIPRKKQYEAIYFPRTPTFCSLYLAIAPKGRSDS